MLELLHGEAVLRYFRAGALLERPVEKLGSN
jgi:hypothetical protein